MGILPEIYEDWSGVPDHSIFATDPVAVACREWSEARELDHERNSLAQDLKAVLAEDIAAETERAFGTPSTRAAYKREFKRFREFCQTEELSWLPTTPETVAYYLIARGGEGASIKSLERAIAAIAFVHRLSDRSWSFDDMMIRAAMRNCKRRLAEEKNGKPQAADESPAPPKETK
jgi:hypothetical protein